MCLPEAEDVSKKLFFRGSPKRTSHLMKIPHDSDGTIRIDSDIEGGEQLCADIKFLETNFMHAHNIFISDTLQLLIFVT